MKISVLIPAYNEKENLEELLNHIHKFREKEDIDWEFIIIDDGSTDGSFELLKKLHGRYPYIKVIKHRRNFGLTEALLTGLHHSTGDALVFFPADLQFHLEDVKKMVAKMEEGYDLVAGKKKGKYEKKFVSSIYNLLSKKLFNINVSDMNSIKVMKREILELLPHRKGWHRYIIPLAQRFMGHGYRPILYVVMTFVIGSLIFLTMGSLGEMIAGLRDRPSDDEKFKVEDKIEE